MYLPILTHKNPAEHPARPEPKQEMVNFKPASSVMAAKMPELQLKVQKMPPKSSCNFSGAQQAGAAMVERMKVMQLTARVAGPMPGRCACSQIWVRMVMQLLKGVKRRKKKRLSLKVYSRALIENYYYGQTQTDITEQRLQLQVFIPIMSSFVSFQRYRWFVSWFSNSCIIINTHKNMEGQDQSIVPLALASYTAISLFFFAFPTLLHKKNILLPLFHQAITQKRILNIAHRGGARIGVQNTIQTFYKGAQVSEMLEMDICETKDNILVVHHDQSLRRVCGLDKRLSDFKFQELPTLKTEVQMHFVEQKTTIMTSGEKIPTLQEVFRQFPDITMSIELKTPSLSAIEELKRLIHLYNRVDSTLIGVVPPFEKKLEQIFPESLRFVSYGSLPKLILLYVTGLLPFFPIHQKSLQIPLYTRAYERMRGRQKGEGWKHKLMFLGLRAGYYIAMPLIWHLRRRGVMTFYWVCNRNQQFKRAIEGGCCGIMTDDPFLLADYLNPK